MGINELKQLQIIGITQLQQKMLVEYVQNDTLIVKKTLQMAIGSKLN